MASNLTRKGPPSSSELLARILDQPALVAAVQALPAEVLGRLVERVGLEDAGEIVALATTGQLRRIFDEDLWRSERPGQDEGFDADRFALWLEVMLEAGEAYAASRLVELPEELVMLALGKQVLVINIEEMAVAMSGRQSDDDVMLEKALESCLCEEIGEYRIISKRHQGWDAVIGVLLALDRDHHEFLARVLERCCHAAAESIEENGGLYQVLTSEEMLETDAAAEREDRRAEDGYIPPSAAASFLALARTTEVAELIAAKEPDPITRAYFRALRGGPAPRPTVPRGRPQSGGPVEGREADGLMRVLREAEVLPKARTAGLLEAPHGGAGAGPQEIFTEAMRRLGERAPDQHARRMGELAFVANVLQAGCSIEARAFRPAEAARAAVTVCNLGLERFVVRQGGSAEEALEQGADRLFRVGWRVLSEEVALATARRIEVLLARTGQSPRQQASSLERAVSSLHAAIAAGKPWTARDKLRVASTLVGDGTLTALLALIDECPHLAGDLRVGMGGELDFVATEKQLRSVLMFLEGLPGIEG